MSSRVQKGGQKFRPIVAKTRPRQADSASRQLSTVPESQVADSPAPDEVVQTSTLPAQTRDSDMEHIASGSNEGALRPIDAALNQVPSASRAATSDGGSSTAEIALKKRSAPTVITVGRSRAPAQGPPTVVVISNEQRTSLPEPSFTPASSHVSTPAPASLPTSAPAPPRIRTSTTSLPEDASVNQEHMESLLSILQNFSSATNGTSVVAGPSYIPDPQTAQQEAQSSNTQPPSVGSDPYGTLSLELGNLSSQQPGTNGETAGTGVADAPRTKPVRRARSKRSKENVAGPSDGEQNTAGETLTKKRRRSKSKAVSEEQPNGEDSQEPKKRVRRSGRRKASRQESTAPDSQSNAASDNNEESGEDVGNSPSKRKSRKPSKRKRGLRAPSLPPVDPDADPGEDLDPTAVTMAAICSDTGQGRVSSKAAVIQKNFALWKQQNREKRARMHAIMEAKKYGRKEDEVDEGGPSETIDIDATEGAGSSSGAGTSEVVEKTIPDASDSENPDDNDNGFDYSQAISTSAFNVQVRIGANGETIIDEESLLVDRGRNAEAETEDYTHVEESDQTKFVNSLSYAKKTRGSRWSKEETELFYDALQQFGENYELISLVLPGRDRKSCKNKFKAEDKRNPGRITECLKNRTPYDIQTLSRLTGKDFSGPTPEIRVPEIPRMGSPDEETRSAGPSENATPGPSAKPSRKRSRTPRVAEDGVEVVGDVDSFVDMDDGENGT